MKSRFVTIAVATLMTAQSVAAATPAPSVAGIASNRAAIGLRVANNQQCAKIDGQVACAQGQDARGGASHVVLLVLALAAIGAGIAAAASGGRKTPTSA